MAYPVLPSPDNFLAVALVINRSRDGPRFVFHYPPHVLPPQAAAAARDGDDLDDLDEEDEALLHRVSHAVGIDASSSSPLKESELSQWNHDDHLITESGTQIVPWEHVAGFPTKDLENILTPARAYHKRLFQVSLDPLYCVSYPIYVPENGVWRKKSSKKQQRQKDYDDSAPTDADGGPAKTGDKGPSDVDQPAVKEKEEHEDKKASMTMFNLVFILKPKRHEVADLVDILYTHIIKKVNKAYKYCQQRSDFIWKESKKILALKDKGREDKRKMSQLWDEILATSSLAASMQDIYDAISRNRIAAIQLETIEGVVTHSVQIPVPFHVPDLPQDGQGEEQYGLWLTTANSLQADESVEEPEYLDKTFALLLMAEEKKVIQELLGPESDPTTQAMVEFVRRCKPNLSFHQVQQQASSVLSPAQVRKFAQHFIFWRRAIAIPPLHGRDMYIVSPNCDLRRLPQAAAQWAKQFPLSPPLPNFLAELSVAPRPYKLHCPSKAHRPLYMAMLAWLMRGGWVTQLCTFAYVVVWPEIIYEVEYELEAEEIAREKAKAQNRGREDEVPKHDDMLSPKTVDNSDDTGGGFSNNNNSLAAALSEGPLASFAGSGFLSLTADSSASTSDLDSSSATLRDLSISSHSPTLSRAQGQPASTPINELLPTLTSPMSTTSLSTLILGTSDYMLNNPYKESNPNSQNNNDRPSSPTASYASTSNLRPTLQLTRTISEDTTASTGTSSTHHQPTPAEQAAEKARLERIADKAARELAERAMAHARKAVPQATRHPSVNHAKHLLGMSPHIILDAKKATGKESLYLSAIERRLRGRSGEAAKAKAKAAAESKEGGGGADGSGGAEGTAAGSDEATGAGNNNANAPANTATGGDGTTIPSSSAHITTATATATAGAGSTRSATAHAQRGTKDWDERVANTWPQFWKYFNGRSALERIALQEDMKRKEAWSLLTAMSEYLLCTRHW
ncbi:nitrogen permease regulator of amino acid transport activity 3-domain-containing protein [Sordaria brevicollis]|uniref:Nitrogen permease regulator 3 n=1 Tax=Sordaria brevicollis TaxID=83679 RepID=A0AAE0PAP8_SORBR|nr:nitrogen permease regulator of amino acid transport activity 3-domain-containing protein [Sordaria brevicollis]